MILVGLLAGLLPRPWFLVGVVVASCGWAAWLVVADIVAAGDTANVVGAFLLALANVLVGVGLIKAAAKLIRTLASQT
jgi:hypothetical protein